MTFKCFGKVCGDLLRQPNLSRHRILAVHKPFPIACFILAIFTACGGRSSKSMALDDSTAPVLLFNGTGVSPNDVVAIETILETNHINYSTVTSSELNAMDQTQMMNYRLLIVPGGNFIEMGNHLTAQTAANIRSAVQAGLNYIGICAGAFLAGSSSYYNGFNLTSGVTFGFYSAEKKGVRKSAVAITSPGSPTLDQYWEDGPQLSGWGEVVAKYPDNTAAVAEGKCGNGFVILTGTHPEAPANWRGGMVFNTSVSDDNAYAARLIHAALNNVPLSHY
jgi:glutamine amidotransferase-like uncharacterized protein